MNRKSNKQVVKMAEKWVEERQKSGFTLHGFTNALGQFLEAHQTILVEVVPSDIITEKPTQAQLEAAFQKVQPANDWKNPIDALIDSEDREMVYQAVIHFTGTVPDFAAVKGGKLRVKAAGYRMGPCGP